MFLMVYGHNVWIEIVNPYIFCRGKKVERLVADFFYDSVWNKKKDKKPITESIILTDRFGKLL